MQLLERDDQTRDSPIARSDDRSSSPAAITSPRVVGLDNLPFHPRRTPVIWFPVGWQIAPSWESMVLLIILVTAPFVVSSGVRLVARRPAIRLD